ncbi:hypothetical protein KKF81_04790 [Candidatus Micrarchaeota archaeon]|nr:hypothetical protein [Candidatus Micrarchaeota archaeon]MBU1166244.1 hypothetical protein [Candidatus Micrarchaeota archaeon]MBU1886799.1 hypothetical protein [Candidatus Micrarchaeota archaeon]
MKLIMIMLVFAGLAFSATVFPQTIPGTGLEILDSNGDMNSGTAHYSTSDEKTIAIVSTEPMSYADWNEITQTYDEGQVEKKIVGNHEYYYVCDDLVGEIQCYMDIYVDSTYYTIDISSLDSTKAETLQVGISIGEYILKDEEKEQLLCCPSTALLALLIPVALLIRS